jgi:Zn-finger nucleic acid-binding protein
MREREREVSNGQVVVMDVCPSCSGVWLDRGELETLTRAESRYYDGSRGRTRRDDRDDDDDNGGGFLGNLFGGFGFYD